MAYNTMNPVGSTDARDLLDNATNLDIAVNGSAARWTDRLGVSRPSWAGMVNYVDRGAYAAGIVITGYNETFLFEGEFYRAAAITALPYTTTGSWSDDGNYFVSVGDAILRSELSTGMFGEINGMINVAYFGTLEEARTNSEAVGKTIVVTDPLTEAQSNITATWPTDRALKCEKGGSINPTTLFTGLKYVDPYWFGAVGDGVADDTLALQRTLTAASAGAGGVSPVNTWASEVVFPPGTYKITNTLNVPRGISIRGTNARTHSGCTIKQVTAGKNIFDLYGVLYDTNRRTADQKIAGFKFISVGGAVRAVATDYPGSTTSIGSLTIIDNHFLNVDGTYAIDTDGHIENVSNNTFDYCAVGHIRSAGGRFSNNIFYQAAAGALVFNTDLLPTNLGYVPTIINGNQFIGNGSASSSDPLKAAIAFTGSSTMYATSITSNTFSGTDTGAGSVGIQSDVNVGLTGINFSNNIFSQLSGNAVWLSHVKASNISNNVFKSCGKTILGSNIVNFVTDSTDNNLIGNSFTDCGGSFNLAFGGSSSNNTIALTKQDTNRVSLPSGTATMVDYSEGLFTPQVTFGGVNVSTTPTGCKYVRIGKIVKLEGSIAFDRGAQTGSMKITGVPFSFTGLNKMEITAGITIPAGYYDIFFNGPDETCYFAGTSGVATANNTNISTGTLGFNFTGVL